MLEGVCTALGLIQGVLVALNWRSNWIFYVAQTIGLFIFSWLNHLYGDMVNNAIYFVFGILGFVLWGRKGQSRIGVVGHGERIVYLLFTALATLILYNFLKQSDDPMPLLDAVTTVTSFVATYYMVKKKIDTWVIWFVNDILYVVEYFLLPERAIMLGILNAVWTGLAVFSFVNWLRIMKKQKGERQSEMLRKPSTLADWFS